MSEALDSPGREALPLPNSVQVIGEEGGDDQ